MKSKPLIIVLAAGQGSRFEGPSHKLSQGLGAGRGSVLAQTVQHAIETRLPVVVVTTAALVAEVSASVARRDLVVLPEVGSAAGLGMGHSIAAGVSSRPDAAGWLVLPGDMPLVQPASLLAVAAALDQHPVVYAQHQGRRGHPVGFAAELYSELAQLSGDEGARRVMARYPSVGIELADAGVLLDVDTQADLQALRQQLSPAVAAQRADG